MMLGPRALSPKQPLAPFGERSREDPGHRRRSGLFSRQSRRGPRGAPGHGPGGGRGAQLQRPGRVGLAGRSRWNRTARGAGGVLPPAPRPAWSHTEAPGRARGCLGTVDNYLGAQVRPCPPGSIDGLRRSDDVQLGELRRGVVGDRLERESEPGADHGHRQVGGEELEHLAFPRRQVRERLGGRPPSGSRTTCSPARSTRRSTR
jgi:hypothetical protein